MRQRGGKLRGRTRELDVVDLLVDAGWVAYRIAHGPLDVIAFDRLPPPLFVQVKSTAGGPYERFTPGARAALRDAAERANAEAWLCWWPPGRTVPEWIESSMWPQQREAA